MMNKRNKGSQHFRKKVEKNKRERAIQNAKKQERLKALTKLHEKAMKAKELEEKRTIARLKREEHAKRSAEGMERACR